MKQKILNIGFIGGGLNSAIGATHKIASQMDGRFKLVSGCFSRDKNINEKTAERWSVPSYYDDYKTFMEQEKRNLDVVAILTPTNSHTEIIVEALKHHIPVVCEKTLTTSVTDVHIIKNIVKKYNSFLVTTYNYTGYPMIRELENMIVQGKIGKVIQVNIQMPQESFIRLDKNGNIPEPQKWRLKDSTISTLSLDLGTHLSNMVSFLTKEKPLEVIAMQNSFGHYDVIDNLICMIKYSNNIDCQMWYSKSALGHKNGLQVEIYGTKGSARWYQMNPEFLEFNDNLGRNIILDRSSKDIEIADQERYNRFKSGHPAGFIEAFANHYNDIYENLIYYKTREKSHLAKYIFDIESSLEGLTLMEAIEKSIKSKKWEKINVEN
jgi:predicted dehydrogenase